MNKYEFLSVLRDRLSGLPAEDMERTIDYYSEIIDDRIEEGVTEEDAVAGLGSIDEIVSQIYMETSQSKPIKEKVINRRTLSKWEITLLILGSPIWLPLLLAAVVVVLAVGIVILAVYIVIWALVVSLYAVNLSFLVCAIAGIIGLFALWFCGKLAQGMLLLGIGLICAGIAILLFFAINQMTKGVIILGKNVLLGLRNNILRKGNI